MGPLVTFAILAGGQGRRLQGADKGLVKVAGRRMIDWVLMNAPADCPGLIVANRNLDIYAQLGASVVSDPWPTRLGPLGGFLAALRAAETEWIQVLSCDGLLLPPHLHQRLLSAAQQQGCPAAYPTVASQGEFVHALLNRRVKPRLEQALASGERGVGRWLRDIAACTVAIEESAAPLIWSINTAGELQRAEEVLLAGAQLARRRFVAKPTAPSNMAAPLPASRNTTR